MFKLNLKNKKHKIYLLIIAIFILLSFVSIATFSRQTNRNPLDISSEWDGSIASGYRKGIGSKDNPYVISNASEFAYFSSMLKINDYKNTYFELNNDIIINKGTFLYEDDLLKYILNENTYYIDKYSNDYYSSSDMSLKLGNINIFKSLDNFKGTFNGNSHTIYGAYITDSNSKFLGLFTNLEGNVKNLYIKNSVILGGIVTGGIASNATNSEISNTIFDGYVIGNNNYVYSKEILLDDIKLTKDNNVFNIELSNDLNYDIESIKLKGILNGLNDDSSLKIGENIIINGQFTIDLSPDIDNINLVYNSTTSGEINITDLSYEINYITGISAGIIADSNSTNIINSINKGYIYGYNYSSGLVGIGKSNLSISNCYNNGQIRSNNMSSGLVSYLNESTSTITNSYNSGEIINNLNAGIIGQIKDSNNILIKNVFNTYEDAYFISNILNSQVNINNSYNINDKYIVNGNYNGIISLVSESNLKNKNFLINNLFFEEFIDIDNLNINNNLVWVYEENNYPILYIDDIKNPIASINISSYSWNNVSYDLNEIIINDNITFNISAINDLVSIKEIYYYINKGKNILSYNELSSISNWNLYSKPQIITEEGFYIIYAKVIDSNDNIYYINSDILVLDLSGSAIHIKYDDKRLDTLNENPSNYFINKPINLYVEAIDNISDIKEVKYYLSKKILSKKDLLLIEDNNWLEYNDKIEINDSFVVYVKVINGSGIISYANSDLILYEGYNNTDLYLSGNENESYDALNVTNNSIITLKYEYKSNYLFNDNETNYLVSNIKLPENTKIILNLNGNIYSYIVTNNDFILKDSLYFYSFELFNLVGKNTNEKFVRNKNEEVNDIYRVTLDFNNVSINEDIIDLIVSIKILDEKENIIRDTIEDSVKKISLYNDKDANISMDSNYSGEVMYNSSSVTDVNLNLVKEYKDDIIDTNIKDMVWGINIKVIDSSLNIVNYEYLKNIKFEIDNKKYSMNSDIVNINLSSVDNNLNKTLKIITDIDNSTLNNGIYSFIITGYLSYDGVLPNKITNKCLDIKLNVSNSKNTDDYSFSVEDNNLKIIEKKLKDYQLNYNILYSGNLKNPKLYVSLLEKSFLSSYDTNYSLIDIKEYINNDFKLYKDKLYLLSDNNIMIDFNISKLNYNLYKLRFYLYDDDNVMGYIDKPFIVK